MMTKSRATGLCLSALVLAGICYNDYVNKSFHDRPAWTQTQYDVPATVPTATAYTYAELVNTGAADLAEAKGARVLFESVGEPHMRLYDTAASHPACVVNGLPMQVAQIDGKGYSCYRWVDGRVAVRTADNRFDFFAGDTFRAK